MTRPGVLAFVLGLARAAPSAFRHDPLFRTAAIGAVLALLTVLGEAGQRFRPSKLDGMATKERLVGHDDAVPDVPPPPAVLGTSYGDLDVVPPSPPSPAAPRTTEPIRPSRSLDGVMVRPDLSVPADRFGTLGSLHPRPETPDAP